jgi:flagellar hook assembly protein FlgD
VVPNQGPQDFILNQNYPNPFNNQTKIDFSAPSNETVQLIIYNTLGQKVKELFNGVSLSGRNTLYWNGTDDSGSSVASGIYFYSLISQEKVFSKKMVLLK